MPPKSNPCSSWTSDFPAIPSPLSWPEDGSARAHRQRCGDPRRRGVCGHRTKPPQNRQEPPGAGRKLQHIRHTDKTLESITERYQKELEGIKQKKKDILDQAAKEAENIVKGANRTIENTIRTIKESQADKEKTQEARKEIQDFMSALQAKKEQDQKNHDDYVERKLRQLNSRQKGKQRKERRLAGDDMTMEEFRGGPLKVGEKVRVKENRMVGEVIRVSNKAVTIAVGILRA